MTRFRIEVVYECCVEVDLDYIITIARQVGTKYTWNLFRRCHRGRFLIPLHSPSRVAL